MPTVLIGDLCNNHCGSRLILEAMIKAAAQTGIDIVKTQSFKADKLRKDWPDYENAYRYYKQHELSDSDHYFLMEKCHENNIDYLTTVFDLETVDFLAGELGLKQIKIASPDANNWALLEKCLIKFDKIIVSTGLHTTREVAELMSFIEDNQAISKFTIFHCVSEYPASIERLNMKFMEPIKSNGLAYGFSDHTIGLDAAKLAIAMGADYVERHFTLSRYLPGKDQAISSTPEEFAELVAWKRKVELMRGNKIKELSAEELKNREKYRGRWSA